MTEVAEMFGAETILMNRAVNRTVYEKVVALINDYKQYCFDNHASISGNPSLGNLDGGISTLEDKALGCTQKGGTAPVVDVLEYAHPCSGRDFSALCTGKRYGGNHGARIVLPDGYFHHGPWAHLTVDLSRR